MRVSIGSDHRGIEVRSWIQSTLENLNCSVDDRGTHSEESCDYPDIAADVARQVADAKSDRGILICGTGIGVSIAANKISGVRAAVCHNEETASLSRLHNDANVLCLPGNNADQETIASIVQTWIETDFEGGRHARRVDKIAELECDHTKSS